MTMTTDMNVMDPDITIPICSAPLGPSFRLQQVGCSLVSCHNLLMACSNIHIAVVRSPVRHKEASL